VKRRAIFLDRDGTLIRDHPYRDTPDGMRLLPRVAQGLRAWVASGYVPVIVTNQSGLARGLFTRKTLGLIHARLLELLKERGVEIEAIYVCPHLPDGPVKRYARRCACRKPKPGLLKRAAKELRLDLRRSVMIGDSPKDAGAGRAAGAKAILLGRDARDLLDAHRRLKASSSARRPAGTSPAGSPSRP
jgi:D-glycero-D-manno-heptose 1,7-bisphosphate phosphatase